MAQQLLKAITTCQAPSGAPTFFVSLAFEVDATIFPKLQTGRASEALEGEFLTKDAQQVKAENEANPDAKSVQRNFSQDNQPLGMQTPAEIKQGKDA